MYDENYFERGIETGVSLYSNYRWIPELTIPLCHAIIEQLGIRESDTILDFGCAKGYMVKGLRLLYREAYGIDTSEYAIGSAPEDIKQYLQCTDTLYNKYDWVIAKDVLEHIDAKKVGDILKNIAEYCRYLFCIIPLGDGHNFKIPAYEKDITHVNRDTEPMWLYRFEACNFKLVKFSYHMDHMKENWKDYKYGNGFFILKSTV